MKKLLATCGIAILLTQAAYSNSTVSTTLVISQIYGDGGTTGSTYANDFIEIYNVGNTAIDLSNYSVQYASGTSWTMTALTAVLLQPGEYYLVKEASNGTGGIPIPYADVTGTISLHSNSGKVALVNSTSVLPNGCASASIVDLVGYGNATCYEGAAATAGSNILSMKRKAGNIDSDNNSVDFITASPAPRTSTFVLPISISKFFANKNGKSNELHWQLNCTGSSITFQLQRSATGVNFENIYTENATRIRCESPFVFTDTKPFPLNYYRLKTIDAEKNISYSNIIVMSNTINEREILRVNPTAVTDQATIKYFSTVAENIQCIINDMQGNTIKRMAGVVIPGENSIQLKTSYLSRGQYQLHVYTLHGSTAAVKFVKQ